MGGGQGPWAGQRTHCQVTDRSRGQPLAGAGARRDTRRRYEVWLADGNSLLPKTGPCSASCNDALGLGIPLAYLDCCQGRRVVLKATD